MEVTASTCCLIVWAVLSLAYIRYVHWLKLCDAGLKDDFAKYRRSDPNYKVWTLFSFTQPIPAYIGLIGSLLTACVFTSVPWWNGTFSGQKFIIAYGAPIVIVLMWLLLKLNRWYFSHDEGLALKWWVTLDKNEGRLQRCIGDLTWQELAPGPRRRDARLQRLRAALRRHRKPDDDPDPIPSPPPSRSHADSHELSFLPNGTLSGHPHGQPRTPSLHNGSLAEDQDGSAHAIRVVDTGHAEPEAEAETESGWTTKERSSSVEASQGGNGNGEDVRQRL